MPKTACPRGEELIAYQDGDLEPARQAAVEAHVRECLACRRRLSMSEDIGRLIREHSALVDDAAGRAEVMTRVRMGAAARTPPVGLGGSRRWQPLAAALLVAFLALGALGRAQVVDGGSSLTRWLRAETTSGRVTPSDRMRETPLAVPTGMTAAPSLPLGLALVDGGRAADGFVERYYRNAEGLAISVSEDRAGTSWVTAPKDADEGEIVGIGGRDVLFIYGMTRDRVMALSWVDSDTFYVVSVLDQPPSGFGLDSARELVAALMAQDR